jgi:hypothetical protein
MNYCYDVRSSEITETVRGLVQEHAEAGVSSGTKVICRSCGHARPLIGSVHYGRRYRLCSDCSLSYELARAHGAVRNVEGFVLGQLYRTYPEAANESEAEGNITRRQCGPGYARGYRDFLNNTGAGVSSGYYIDK